MDDKITELIKEIKNKFVWIPLVIISVILSFILAKNMLLPALSPSDKWATDVIHESEDGEYAHDVLERIDED